MIIAGEKLTPDFELVSLPQGRKFDIIFFLDVEVTCWEDSLLTGWADPKFPPEILQIAFVVFDTQLMKVVDQYSRYIKPVVNPRLSDYCKNLLNIEQNIIDRADTLVNATDSISQMIERKYKGQKIITSSWGLDRLMINQDLQRQEGVDPFRGVPHLDLEQAVIKTMDIKGVESIEREDVRERLKIDNRLHDHNALSDSLDLVKIYRSVQQEVK